MNRLWQDLRFALRMLRKSPGFTVVAILTLALGIGANTAIFSLLNAVMLQSIPVRNPEQLMVLRWSAHGRPQDSGNGSFGDCPWTNWTDNFAGGCSFSYPAFQLIRSHELGFSSVAAFAGPARVDLTGNGTANMAGAELVSGDYFQTLGVPAALGRTIQPDDAQEGAAAVAVLSYAYWQGAFGGDSHVVGRTVKLDGVPFTIVGVADASFTRLTPGHTYDMWVPLSQAKPPLWAPGSTDGHNWWLVVIGRLKPGTTRQQAQTVASLLFRDTLVADKMFKAEDQPEVAAIPAQKALAGIRTQLGLGQPLIILMTAVAILLLVSCANVAGLMLARATTREREMAVRLALGAGRTRLIRQLLTESVMLAFAGAALGVMIAYWGAAALTAFFSANSYSSVAINSSPDATVLGFTIAVAALTGILFGLAPALRSSRVNVGPVLKENAGSISGGSFGSRRRFGLGNALVVAQVALSVIVLAGAGLVVRSLANLENINPGFDTHNLLQFAIDPSLTGYYKTEQMGPLYRELQRKLSALPGVQAVSYGGTLLDGGLWTDDVKIEGRADKGTVRSQMLAVGSDFFTTMKIPLLAGRTLTAQDMSSTQPVAVVNRAFVEKFLDKREPLGLHFGDDDPKDPQYEIVGVVGDTKYEDLRDEIRPTAFVPLKEGEAHFALRTAINPQALIPAVRKTVSELDNNLPLYEVKTQTERIERLLFSERMVARLASLFGLTALALACIGLYGLLAYEVARRTREIGIRSALGAQRRDVLALIGRQGLALVICGALLGLAGALGVTRLLASLLYGVTPSDPLTFAGVCLLLMLVAATACYIPARRAMRVDPMVALRYE